LGASAGAIPATASAARHSALVRITHWLTTLSFFALLASGMLIVTSHPRFYWGEAGNIHTEPLFKLPIPASRSIVPIGDSRICPPWLGLS
jgi:Prokaryotic cytochrome b561